MFDAEGGSNGLYLMRMRHYSPGGLGGRWLQRDPAGYMDSANLYGYVAGNPIGLGGRDPYGLQQAGQHGEFVGADPVQFGGTGGLSRFNDVARSGLGDISPQDRLDPLFSLAIHVLDPSGLPTDRMSREDWESQQGALAQWWGWWNSDDPLAIRGRGALSMLGGIASMPFGPFGFIFGADQAQSGFRQMMSGEITHTQAHAGLVMGTGSKRSADIIENAIAFITIGRAAVALVHVAGGGTWRGKNSLLRTPMRLQKISIAKLVDSSTSLRCRAARSCRTHDEELVDESL